MLVGVLLLSGFSVAADVMLPSATSRSPEDQALAADFHAKVLAAAASMRLSVDGPDAIRQWVGDANAEACYARPERCPADLWVHTDARLAMVMVVGRTTDGLTQVEARYFAAGSSSPIHVVNEQVPVGDTRLPTTLVAVAMDILPLIPPRDVPRTTAQAPVDPDVPTRIGGGRPPETPVVRPSTTEPTTPPPNDPVTPEPSVPSTVVSPSAPSDTPDLYRRIPDPGSDLRLPASVRAAWIAAGRPDAATWLAQQHVRVAHGWINIDGGYAIGEVDRAYALSNYYDPYAAQTGRAWAEGPATGAGPTFGVGFGWMPAWYVDLSLRGALQNSHDHIKRCTSAVDPAEPGSDQQCLTEGGERGDPTNDLDSSVQWVIEPRARWYPTATGRFKPYALTGVSARIHTGPSKQYRRTVEYGDGSTVELDYPTVGPGMSLGLNVGLGAVIEILPSAALYLELPYSLWVVPGIDDGSEGYMVRQPSVPTAGPHHSFRMLLGLELHL